LFENDKCKSLKLTKFKKLLVEEVEIDGSLKLKKFEAG